jgi:CheY-like chemotaxis protein
VKVLVVEDEARILEFVARGLREQGFHVQVEVDGLAGLAAALHDEIDLLILDLNLPKLSGEQLLERLTVAGPSLPVLVLSAKDSVEDQVRNLNAGRMTTCPTHSVSPSSSPAWKHGSVTGHRSSRPTSSTAACASTHEHGVCSP